MIEPQMPYVEQKMPVKKARANDSPTCSSGRAKPSCGGSVGADHTGGGAGVPGKRHEGTFRGWKRSVLIWVILVTPVVYIHNN